MKTLNPVGHEYWVLRTSSPLENRRLRWVWYKYRVMAHKPIRVGGQVVMVESVEQVDMVEMAMGEWRVLNALTQSRIREILG